jgi:hypothetical protein
MPSPIIAIIVYIIVYCWMDTWVLLPWRAVRCKHSLTEAWLAAFHLLSNHNHNPRTAITIHSKAGNSHVRLLAMIVIRVTLRNRCGILVH